jgi:hypothetical protein
MEMIYECNPLNAQEYASQKTCCRVQLGSTFPQCLSHFIIGSFTFNHIAIMDFNSIDKKSEPADAGSQDCFLFRLL